MAPVTGFLDEVAADLYRRYGEELSSLSILFPSRRARLFFTDALARVADRPLWQPRWTTIDELMSEISGLRVGDRVRLITELYKCYSHFHEESFDKFYFWGEVLLADFDTIDKYRIDAGMLFRNLSDLKELESDLSYLTPEQLRIISTFWATFRDGAELSEEKRRFLAIWKTLGPLYKMYRERLTSLGLAYSGMVHRAAAEKLSRGEFAFDSPRRFVVAGFNALSECEKRLFQFLSTAAETDFYWDYDSYYKEDRRQEAGMFLRDNLTAFPPRVEISHDHFLAPKRMEVVSTVSNAVQCKYTAEILKKLAAGGVLDKNTAVVLTDEELLLPLLHALPPELGKVNVTMGYPLKQSLAYSFVERLIELQAHARKKGEEIHFYHVDATGILSHPYVVGDDPKACADLRAGIISDRRITIAAEELSVTSLLEVLFRPTGEWRELADYLLEALAATARIPYEGDEARRRVEFLAVISEELTKLRNSLDACDVKITTSIFTSLLRRHLQTLRIPYEGEPLEGLQVMGILETRNLDFENVVILSMNDDNFPGKLASAASYIPYNLKAAYALPTPEHHEGVYAYYFYRLLQRARNVRMVYCSHADEKSTGEPSRYIRQLEYETEFKIARTEVGVDVNLAPIEPIEVAKEGDVLEKLRRFTAEEEPAALSPTAFFRYVACPLRFYFHSVARLRPDEELSEEVDAPMFGTILHVAAQRLYTPVVNEVRPGETLRALARSGEVARAVAEAINEHYLRDLEATTEEYSGNLLLVRDIVTCYLRGGILPWDAAHDDFVVEGLEQEIGCDFPFESGGESLRVRFGGQADRIDRLGDGTLRVVDYKTSEPHLEFAGLEPLFHGEGRQRQSNILQTLLYAMMLCHTRGVDAEPTLYYVRAMNRPDYAPQLIDKELKRTGVRYSEYADRFEELLRETLAELFDPAVPFRQTDDAEHTCRYCDFKELCRR